MRDYKFLDMLSQQEGPLTQTEKIRLREISAAVEAAEKERLGQEECEECHRYFFPSGLCIVGDPFADQHVLCRSRCAHRWVRAETDAEFNAKVKLHPLDKP